MWNSLVMPISTRFKNRKVIVQDCKGPEVLPQVFKMPFLNRQICFCCLKISFSESRLQCTWHYVPFLAQPVQYWDFSKHPLSIKQEKSNMQSDQDKDHICFLRVGHKSIEIAENQKTFNNIQATWLVSTDTYEMAYFSALKIFLTYRYSGGRDKQSYQTLIELVLNPENFIFQNWDWASRADEQFKICETILDKKPLTSRSSTFAFLGKQNIWKNRYAANCRVLTINWCFFIFSHSEIFNKNTCS